MTETSKAHTCCHQENLLWLACPSCGHELSLPKEEAVNGLEVRCGQCGNPSWLERAYEDDGSGGHWTLEPDRYEEED